MTTKVNERALVLEMLLTVNEEGQYSHLVLRDVLDKYQYLGKQERAFLTRLMEGTLERQLTLDYVIDQFSKTRVKKMKPLIRNLMRMSVYQIMYMDSVPDSAAVNEAVGLTLHGPDPGFCCLQRGGKAGEKAWVFRPERICQRCAA